MALLWLHSVLVICLLASTAHSVEIRELSVPTYVEYGTSDTDEVILDCNYDFSEEERDQLDIKWYFNGEPAPFLQWIPSMGRPLQLIGSRFRGHVDLNYTVAGADRHKRHRALRLINLTPELGGSYKCKVSTLTDEDFKQKNLIIFAAPSEVEFVLENRGDRCNVTCSVLGVYPEPAISITRTTKEHGTYLLWEDDPSHNRLVPSVTDPALYDSSLSVSISHTSLEDETEFVCNIALSATEINFTESAMYYKVTKDDENDVLLRHEKDDQLLQEEELDEVEKFAREAKEAAINLNSSACFPPTTHYVALWASIALIALLR